MAEPWRISGDYFEVCNCDVACPCVFGSDPTKGDCTVLVGWRIREGEMGRVPLKGLGFALAAHSPGNMFTTKWDVAIYIDERANPAQREALQSILGGQAGGMFAGLGSMIGRVLGVRFVPFEFQAEGRRRSLRIGNVGESRSEAIEGAHGRETTIAGAPLLLAPQVTVAKGQALVLSDHGWAWNASGGSSFYAPFEFRGP